MNRPKRRKRPTVEPDQTAAQDAERQQWRRSANQTRARLRAMGYRTSDASDDTVADLKEDAP